MKADALPPQATQASSHAPPEARAIPEVGELVSGKYRVDGTAGTGGMGVVLSATHVELGHRVAIKVLATGEAPDSIAVERFTREAKAAACLQSDHVVRIHDVGRLATGAPYMVMELLRGQDLATHVRAVGRIEPAQAVNWILQACDAIAEAHQYGIIHRDLKPANLFLTRRSDGTDHVKVLDFGISKRIADNPSFQGALTSTRQVVGSPAYMSPEQVRNQQQIDSRTDIWALGMTLYELLAGRPAFNADTFPAACAAIVADLPPPLTQVAPGVPAALERVVLKCLEKDPRDRFATVGEFVDALRPFSLPASGPIRDERAIVSGTIEDPKRSTQNIEGTLASARAPTAVQSKETRAPSETQDHWLSKTLNSNRGETRVESRHEPLPARRGLHRHVAWVAIGIAGVGAGAILKHKSVPSAAQATAASVTPVESAVFQVQFESEPSGANVVENGRSFGNTPLVLAVEHQTVRNSPRVFQLKLAGYETYVVEQSDSRQDLRVLARLTPTAQTSAEVAGSTAPSSRVTSGTPHATNHGPLTQASGTPRSPVSNPDDIRSSR